MLDKCEEGTRYIHGNQFESAIVPNAFSTTRTSNRRPAKPEGKQWQRPANEIVYVLTAR